MVQCSETWKNLTQYVCDVRGFGPKSKVPTPQRDILSLPGSSIVKMLPRHDGSRTGARGFRRALAGCRRRVNMVGVNIAIITINRIAIITTINRIATFTTININ